MLQCSFLCSEYSVDMNSVITCMYVGQEGPQLLLLSQLLYQHIYRTAAYTTGVLDKLQHSTAAAKSFGCAAVLTAVLHSKLHCLRTAYYRQFCLKADVCTLPSRVLAHCGVQKTDYLLYHDISDLPQQAVVRSQCCSA
jgi:hypothetical protein